VAKDKRKLYKNRATTGRYLKIPATVLDCEKFVALSFKARALLLDLGAQYNGFNNGDFSASWTRQELRGWKSKQTLQRALKELEESGLIDCTRHGGRHCCSLFGFTWLPIDRCGGKLEVAPTAVGSGRWRK